MMLRLALWGLGGAAEGVRAGWYRRVWEGVGVLGGRYEEDLNASLT